MAPTLDAALERAHELDDEVFIVGGAQVYAQALEAGLVDLMCVTRVAASPDGDTRFPRSTGRAVARGRPRSVRR